MRRILVLTSLLLFACIADVFAADELRHLDFKVAMESPKVEGALLPQVDLYFIGDEHPEMIREYGTFRTTRRTNAFLKDKFGACEWALASALVHLQESALEYGGNAIIDITSNLNHRKSPAADQYDCLVGAMMVQVEIEGRVVKLDK